MRSGRSIRMASGAGRSDGQDRIHRPLRIHHRVLPGREIPFAAVDMAYGAVAALADGPLRAHCGITDVGEIVMRPPTNDHDIRPVISEQAVTQMDAMRDQ